MTARGVVEPSEVLPKMTRVVNKESGAPVKKKPGRKSNSERERIRAEQEMQKRRAARDAKRAQPLLPDTKVSLIIAVALVGILMVSSFTVSFAGIYEVAAFTGIPHYLQWLPGVFIDMAILAYTISLMIFKSRGHSTWRTMAGLSGFAVLSVGANISHTLAFWHGNTSDWRAWVGVVITAAAPVAVLLASEEIGRLAFVEPIG